MSHLQQGFNILCSYDKFCSFNSSMNSILFFTVFLDCRKGDNNSERYFANLYVAMFRFESIGRIGRSLIPPSTENLSILAVP